MFCANTSPLPVATTDLGEMLPVTVRASRSGRSTAGGSGTVVVVEVDAVAGAVGWTAAVEPDFGPVGASPADRREPDPRDSTPKTIAAPTSATTKNTRAARRCTGHCREVPGREQGGRRCALPVVRLGIRS